MSEFECQWVNLWMILTFVWFEAEAGGHLMLLLLDVFRRGMTELSDVNL